MSAISTSIRWLLVPVSAAAVVAICIAAARWAVSVADRSCPAESMVGGACVEPWHTAAVEVSIYTGMVLAVLGLVILPSMIAPHLKRAVAVVLCVAAIAVVASIYRMTTWSELLLPLTVTVVTGAVALLWVWLRRTSNDRS